jgi:hypothetical protein
MCTETPQWVFILRGVMEIGLQDGSFRAFRPGEHFFSADVLPPAPPSTRRCTATGAASPARTRWSPLFVRG